jgi:Holliday junction DNA helicase RuvA
LIIELRDRVGQVGTAELAAVQSLADGWPEPVRQALVGLGWSPGQADAAVAAVAEELDGAPPPPVPALLKQAIRLLGRSR